jgi:hypothetical protein
MPHSFPHPISTVRQRKIDPACFCALRTQSLLFTSELEWLDHKTSVYRLLHFLRGNWGSHVPVTHLFFCILVSNILL